MTQGGLKQLLEHGVISGWHEGIKRLHLLERLAAALVIVGPDAEGQRQLLDERRDRLDAQSSAIDSIEHSLTRRNKGAQSSKSGSQPTVVAWNRQRTPWCLRGGRH